MASSSEEDRLYGLPLDKFTAERNKLAARLRKEGKKEEAEQVKALKKPTLASWAANQLARKERMKLRALTEAAEQVRKAQTKVLEGGKPELLKEADDRLSSVTADLRKAAGGVLTQAGHPASEALLDRIRQTLRAAVLNDADLERLKQGKLVEDLNPAGFGGLVGVAKARRRKPPDRPKREDVEKRKRELATARERVAQQRKAVQEAKKRLREEEAELTRVKSELDRLSR